MLDKNRMISPTELETAVENVKNTLHTMWATSLSKDSDGREDCYYQIKALDMAVLQLIRDLEA
jgi:hypothetical protein